MSTEPEGVWPGFSAHCIWVPLGDPTTPIRPAGSQPLLDVSTQSPLAESNAGAPEAGPSRLPGAPLLSFPHSTSINHPPPIPPENPQTFPNNPFVAQSQLSPQPAAQLRDPGIFHRISPIPLRHLPMIPSGTWRRPCCYSPRHSGLCRKFRTPLISGSQ